ncbi:hypothetical protein HDV57DRAFT_319199 [Trichoderma longibrachiatum]
MRRSRRVVSVVYLRRGALGSEENRTHMPCELLGGLGDCTACQLGIAMVENRVLDCRCSRHVPRAISLLSVFCPPFEFPPLLALVRITEETEKETALTNFAGRLAASVVYNLIQCPSFRLLVCSHSRQST